ncbi:hypothetical protein Hte_010194 [Hypoxylon texense]
MKFSKAPAAPLLLLVLLRAYAPAQALSPSRAAAAKRADNSGSPGADDDDDDDGGGDDYLVSVCLPSAAPDTTALPPCLDVIAIETACAPNGTPRGARPVPLRRQLGTSPSGSGAAGASRCTASLSPGNSTTPNFSTVIAKRQPRAVCARGRRRRPLASLFTSVEGRGAGADADADADAGRGAAGCQQGGRGGEPVLHGERAPGARADYRERDAGDDGAGGRQQVVVIAVCRERGCSVDYDEYHVKLE